MSSYSSLNYAVNRSQYDKADLVLLKPPVYEPIIIDHSSITQNDFREILSSSKKISSFQCLTPAKEIL